MLKKCIICFKEFETSYTQRKCCSEKCSKINKKNNKKEYDKKPDNVKKNRIASRKNYKKNNPPKFKKCKICAKEFRMIRNQVCCSKECIEINKKNNKKEYDKKYMTKYREEHKEEISEQRRRYFRDNKEDIYKKVRKRKQNWAKEKRKNDPQYKLSDNMRGRLYKGLKSHNIQKNKRHWEKLVGYTIQELKEHLESLFTNGMSWDNYGEWHIDHIIPQSFFVYTDTDDVEFKYCWSLDNLQPLWAEENIRKSNKIKDFSNKCSI